MIIFMRGGAVVARWAHNPKVAGSNPVPAIGNMLMTVFVMYKPAHPKRVVITHMLVDFLQDIGWVWFSIINNHTKVDVIVGYKLSLSLTCT